uniref:Protein SHQ1 homolog n=1 Tax=Setaria digitata TaxID=48799 RepID=A0A915Q558_9BILA
MLTPVFKIDQTPEYVVIEIHAPYANVKDAEADYCDLQFFFTSKPYFLKLYLPGELLEDDISGSYDCDKGSFTFKVLKKNAGEFFPNLDLVNQLLKPTEIHAKRLVEETGENNDILTYFSNELQTPQTSSNSTISNFMDKKCEFYGYGFAWSRYGIVGKFSAEIDNLLDLGDPENSLIDERIISCLRHDQLKFDAEYYVADLFEKNPLLDECVQFKYPETAFDLSFKSRDHLKNLPKKLFPKYALDLEKVIALSLVDILFAYLYDMRTTEGEHSSESGWTITKLSPTLSYFVRWKTAKESVIGAIRRSLCFPLYRHWDLSMMVLNDLKFLFNKGRVSLLQCLADIHAILSTSGDYRYLLNDLFVTDYCLWIQLVPDGILSWLHNELSHINLSKNDVQLNLEEIELEAKLRALRVIDGNSEPEDSDDDYSNS